MSSINPKNQVKVLSIQKNSNDAKLKDIIEVFLNRETHFDNLSRRNLYGTQYFFSKILRYIGAILVLGYFLFLAFPFAKYYENWVMSLFSGFLVGHFYFVSLVIYNRSKQALSFYNKDFIITNNWLVRRGKLEYLSRILIFSGNFIIIFILSVSGVAISHEMQIPILVFTLIYICKIVHAAGILVGRIKLELLKNEYYDATLESIHQVGINFSFVAMILVVVSFFYEFENLEASAIYFSTIFFIYRVIKKIKYFKGGWGENNEFYNFSYLHMIWTADEDHLVYTFSDSYEKFKIKKTNNYQIEISEVVLETEFLKQTESKKSMIITMLVTVGLFILTTLLQEIIKEYGFREGIRPILRQLFEDPNTLIKILIVIGCSILIFVIGKKK